MILNEFSWFYRVEPVADQQQPKRKTGGNAINSVKRKMILDWIRDAQGYSESPKVSYLL